MFSKKICQKCGKKNSKKDSFCPNCGTPLRNIQRKDKFGMLGEDDSFNEDVGYTYSQECVDSVSEQAVLKIGEQGGYYSLDYSIYSFPYLVPIYMDGEKKNIPTIEDKSISILR